VSTQTVRPVRIPAERSRLPPGSRLDGAHLPLLRISEVVRVRGRGADSVYQQWTADLLDVPGIRSQRGYLVPRRLEVGVWRAPVQGILEKDRRCARRTRRDCFVRVYHDDHSLHAGWMGRICWRLSGNEGESRLPDEGRRAAGHIRLSAQAGSAEIVGQPTAGHRRIRPTCIRRFSGNAEEKGVGHELPPWLGMVERYALVYGMTSETHRSGASPRTESTPRPSIRSRRPRATDSTTSGSRSTISSRTGISPRSCPWPLPSPPAPRGSASLVECC